MAKFRSFWKVLFVRLIQFLLILHGNVALSIVVLSTKKQYSSFKKTFSFPENSFQSWYWKH